MLEKRDESNIAYKTWINEQTQEGLGELRRGETLDGKQSSHDLRASLDKIERDTEH